MKRNHIFYLSFLLASFLAFALAACAEPSNAADPVPLSAPVIALNENVISWDAVEHADGYEVYENGVRLTASSETSYTITRTEEGSYQYSVKATATSADYSASPFSNAVTFTVKKDASQDPVQLFAPVISLQDNVISWDAVEHASIYEVYEEKTIVAKQTQTAYTVKKTTPGEYRFTVKATSSDAAYTSSEFSNTVTYSVEEQSVPEVKKLSAPAIALDGNVLSWTAIDHATAYVVFENGDPVSTQTETVYTVNPPHKGEYEYAVVAISSNAAYSTSDKSNAVTFVASAPRLAAPILSLEGNVLSWTAVDHAVNYEVYEGDRRVSAQSATTYTIKRVDVGVYLYTVVAMPDSEEFSKSDRSNAVEYVVSDSREALPAPVITIQNNLLSWNEVEHADTYEVYENNVKVSSQVSTSYEILRKNPRVYIYTVRAVSDEGKYAESEFSNAIEYEVKSVQMEFVVHVNFPDNYIGADTFKVGLYQNDSLIASADIKYDKVTLTGSATLTAMSGFYTVKVTKELIGYAVTQTQISAESGPVAINVIPLGGNNMLQLGNNKITFSAAEAGSEKAYVFVALKSGIHSIVADKETKSMICFLNRDIIVDTSQKRLIGEFTASAGEAVEIAVSGETVGLYEFEIVEGEVKQNIAVGTKDNREAGGNFISGNAGTYKRYLQVEKRTTFTFFFTTPTIGLRTVIIKINGIEYAFDGADSNLQEITIDAGEVEILFTVEESPSKEDFDYIAFFVYTE